MIRFCTKCQTERPLSESFCEGEVDGQICGWNLNSVAVRPEGWRPPPAPAAVQAEPAAAACANGHPAQPGDLICSSCGADIVRTDEPAGDSAPEAPPSGGGGSGGRIIGDWQLGAALPASSTVRERFLAQSVIDGRQAVLTLYCEGSEPDAQVYEVLRSLSHDHVPALIETGRFEGRAYEVSEHITGGTLTELGLLGGDLATLTTIVGELGGALNALAECGLRHRDLRPGAVLVRAREPLDLVLSSFGSARLSDFDLDIVSPLETSRYTAPEAIAGGVAAASDWWSLGILLLEQATGGACFEGVNDQAFLIQVVAGGVAIPEGLDPRVALLLNGLLARDRRERWNWSQVLRWLDGETPPTAADHAEPEAKARKALTLGGRRLTGPAAFALAAAQAANWDEARGLLLNGTLATWAEEADFDPNVQAELRQLMRLEEVSDDLRLALALKALNPAIPLTSRGEIITPGWLLDHPAEGYALIAGPAPDLLARKDAEPWLSRLKTRAATVRDRARQMDIVLNEDELRIHLLSTSRSRLAAVWADRRRILPDTDHAGLIALLERRQTADEDYILLLSAAVGQFRTAAAILAEAADEAVGAGIETFSIEEATSRLAEPRRQLIAEIDERLTGFARCDLPKVDDWADRFRLERRLPVARLLALLAVPAEAWKQPAKQAYVATLLDFFAKRITASVLRGPLTRMVIGKTTARLDLTELDSERRPAAALLDHLLMRNGQASDLDPAVFARVEGLERRLRLLHSHANLYRRDTGIDGLYLGFPFLLLQEQRPGTKPRIAPVLLWPVKIQAGVGARGSITVAFDQDREEVRLNPAFEPLLGPEAAARWTEAANELLGRASLSAADVMDAFSQFGCIDGRSLGALPNKEVKVVAGEDRLACAAALFHLAYIGQAVMEDLRSLKAVTPTGTSLESALRVSESPRPSAAERGAEVDRYFTAASDPSQEQAVLEARTGPGLVVEGPPGTGKSQTIVNMIADAIGRNRSLLVVCQKQAALEVVMKRLQAEGLGSRVVMVNDINKDRRRVIEAIREQIETLASRSEGEDGSLRRLRQQTAARIDALEADLDRQHAALHAQDPQSGLTYRLILSDLIGHDAAALPTIDVPALRRLLADLDAGQVAALQEVCGPLARLWLPARYEDSPLAALRAFSPDPGTVEAFDHDFAAFASAEQERRAVQDRTPLARRIDDPAPHQNWVAAHAASLRALDDEARGRLARWLPRFAPAGDAEALLESLAAVAVGVDGLPDANGRAETVAEGLSDEDLAAWTAIADRLAATPGLLGRMSPVRWFEGFKLRRFLKDRGLDRADHLLLCAALHAEAALRPWRRQLAAAQGRLVDSAPLAGLSASALAGEARRLRAELAEVKWLVQRLDAHPDPEAARSAAASGDLAAFDDFLTAMDQGIERHEARAFSLASLDGLEPWFKPDWLASRREAIATDDTDAAVVDAVSEARPTVAAYQRFQPRAAQLEDMALQVFRSLRIVSGRLASTPETDLDEAVRRILLRESRLAWKSRLEAAAPALLMEAMEMKAKVQALIEADRDMREYNSRLLCEGFDTDRISPKRAWEDITRLSGPRAKRLREFLDLGSDLGLMALRPVWLMNPDIASRMLPLRNGLFDTVIYDEASQMPVEYALPTLFRSRSMVVSGDEKQMPPTAFFASRIESDEADSFDGDEEAESEELREELAEAWNRQEIKDCPDLLQLAKTVLPNTTLQIHYRSVYRELIQFSNMAFYGNRLSVPARHPEEEVRRVQPIEVMRVDGVYDGQTNIAEAHKVAEVLDEIWRRPVRPSVGVVTFNRKQADLIEQVLEERAERDTIFRAALAEERDRIENGEDMGFFVKNVENVQGDERDVVVFSSTFGRNPQGTFRRAFGVLGQRGGERRLNVAVTRARSKILLVTSMPIAQVSDLLATRRPAASPRDFLQGWLEYARAISAGELDTARTLIGRLSTDQRADARRRHAIADGFQTSVANFIRRSGYEPVATGEDNAFGLDFAIVDSRTGLFGIGIECDAPRHGLLKHARAREMWRPDILKRSIGAVHRVSSQGWHHDRANEEVLLKAAIDKVFTRKVQV